MLKNVKGKKGLLDDLDSELMAKIVAEVTKKLKGSGSGKDEQEKKSSLMELRNEIQDHMIVRKFHCYLKNGSHKWRRYLMWWKSLIMDA